MKAETHASATRPAVFLDRDDTLIVNVPYLGDPDRIQLLPGAVTALSMLREAGYVLILVTNQSAVGRGFITEDRLAEIHSELLRRLTEAGSSLDAVYYCTHAPRETDQTIVEHPDRKPAPGMLLRAADDMGLDLAASWMVGDQISDVLAGLNAGCRSILVGSNASLDQLPTSMPSHSGRTFAAVDLQAAADLILKSASPFLERS